MEPIHHEKTLVRPGRIEGWAFIYLHEAVEVRFVNSKYAVHLWTWRFDPAYVRWTGKGIFGNRMVGALRFGSYSSGCMIVDPGL